MPLYPILSQGTWIQSTHVIVL